MLAQDLKSPLFNPATGKAEHPATVDLIRGARGLFLANTNSASDALYLADHDSLDFVHYIGFTNLWFEGLGYIRPGGTASMPEEAFYHTTDPATLVAWRSGTGVVLHWIEDLRFAAEGDFVDGGETGSIGIAGYLITRVRVGDPEVVHGFVPAPLHEAVDDSAGAYDYDYTIRSVTVSGDTLSFGATPIRVGASVSPGPHFWAVKRKYLEDVYHDRESFPSGTPIGWPIRFQADQAVDPQFLSVEVFKSSGTSPQDTVVVYGRGDLVYDSAALTIDLDLDVTLERLLLYGGVSYRLHYTADGADIHCPEPRGSWNALVGSTVNNRLMGCNWYEYLMNVEGTAWPDVLIEASAALLGGVVPEGAGTAHAFPDIFYDSVLAMLSGVHNKVRPYDYGGNESFRDRALDLFSRIETAPELAGLSYWANEHDPRMVAELDSLASGDGRLRGFMRENLVKEDNGTIELAKAIWQFRATPQAWRNIVQNSFDYGYDSFERDQSLAAYLLLREGHQAGTIADDVFGFGGWKPAEGRTAPPFDVNILPEQMLRVGDESADLFGAVVWPSWNALLTHTRSVQDAVDWMDGFAAPAPDTTRFVNASGGTSFAVRWFELMDGLPEQDNRIVAVWDIDVVPTPHVWTLAGLFPGLSAQDTLYELVYESEASSLEPARLVDGGAFGSVPVPLDQYLSSTREEAKIFFTAPVRSPWVAAAASDTVCGDPKYGSTLRVAASHWNGGPLDIVVDCLALNGDGEVHLQRGAFDEQSQAYFYEAAIRDVSAADGPLALPYVATGTDGLMRYGTILVEVAAGRSQTFVDYSDSTSVAALRSAIVSPPLATLLVESVGDPVVDLVVTQAGAEGVYLEAQGGDAFVPYFSDATEDMFPAPADPIPAGASSCAAADLDGDRHEDLVACSPAGFRLYRRNALGQYTDATATSISAVPDTVFAASWCDYNRDGYVDLALAGTDSTGDGIHFFRNELGTLVFSQSVPADLGPGVRDFTSAYPLLWADLDLADDSLELLAGVQIDGVPTLQAFARSETFDKSLLRYDFTEAAAAVFPQGGPPTWVTRAVLADLDADGDQDLVVSRAGPGATGEKLQVYRNAAGELEAVASTSGTFTDDLAAVLVADMDPDGNPDIVAVPGGATAPRLLVNTSSTDISFAEKATSLPAGAASGGLAYDWLGGKPNLYLAKTPAGGAVADFYYGFAPAGGVSLGTTVRVRVGETDLVNTSAIGTRIEVEWDGKHAYQWIGGGDGRGGQSPRELVFGIGRVTEAVVVVRALWPDGSVSSFPGFHAGNAILTYGVERSSPPIVDEASVVASFNVNTADDNWYTFAWDADRAGEPEVLFTFSDPRSACWCDYGTGTIELVRDTQDIYVWCRQTDDNIYHYQLAWRHRCCDATLCTFTYRVRSRANGVVSDWSSAAEHTFRTPKFCPSN